MIKKILPPCPYCQIMEKEFHDLGLFPEIIMSVDQESAINAMVKAGVGLNFMLEEDARAAEKKGDVVVWEQESYNLPLSFVTLQVRRDDPRVRALLESVRMVWGWKIGIRDWGVGAHSLHTSPRCNATPLERSALYPGAQFKQLTKSR